MKNNKAAPQTDTKKNVKAEMAAAADNEENNGKGKKVRKVLNIVINVVLIVAIVVAVIATYVSFVSTSGNGVPSIFGLRLMSIQTDSMYPILKPGDLIISTNVDDPSALRPGDIITYWTIINGERVLNTHKIINVYDGGGHLIFETKGENNTAADPMTVHESSLVGIYQFRIPGVGKVFDYLQTPTGFLIVVVVPVFLFFLFHLVQFFRVLFEYQNVKNRIKFETERGRTEDMIAAHEAEKEQKETDRAAMEAELREKLRAELMESMQKEAMAAAAAAAAAAVSANKTSEEVPAAAAKTEADTEKTEQSPADKEAAETPTRTSDAKEACANDKSAAE